jgi:hypothetical protein
MGAWNRQAGSTIGKVHTRGSSNRLFAGENAERPSETRNAQLVISGMDTGRIERRNGPLRMGAVSSNLGGALRPDYFLADIPI